MKKKKRQNCSFRMKNWKTWTIFTIINRIASHLYNLLQSLSKVLVRFGQVFHGTCSKKQFSLLLPKHSWTRLHLFLTTCHVLVGWVLWHINLCRLFNAKSIFIKIVLFPKIHFSMSTQFNCQKHSYFKLFSLFKQFYFSLV